MTAILGLARSMMRSTAAAAWPAFCASYEGRCTWLYLDTLRLPTTGLGHRVFTLPDMLTLPWLTTAGEAATESQKRAEWNRINGRTDLAPKGGFAYQSVATLHLSDATVDGLLMSDTPKYWDPLVAVLPNLPTWPTDAQLALIDMSYNLGANFLGSSWPNFTAACKAGDFTKAAASCLRAVKAPRDYRHQRMFTNAATVVKVGADPDRFWDTKTPTAPVVTPPTPEDSDVAKVKFRNGYTCSCVATSLPIVEQAMIERGLIKQSIDIYQLGYRSDVAASAGTHDAGGNTDVAQFSDAQIQCWREFGWTIQHRTKAQGFDMDHGHGWPYGCTHLSSGGKSQLTQWNNRQNGLVSKSRVTGMWPVPNWRDAMNAYLKAKEDDLPTTSDVVKALTANKDFLTAVADAVLNSDSIPNAGALTSNVDNANVSTKTALTQLGKKSNDISAKLDALIARFPSTPAA